SVRNPTTEAAAAGLVAALLEELGLFGAAEEMYRDYTTRSEHPESLLQFVAFLGRLKRVPEALDLCERAWQKCRPESVAPAGEATEALTRFQRARDVAGQEGQLLVTRADVQLAAGRSGAALAVLRQELTQEQATSCDVLLGQAPRHGKLVGDGLEVLDSDHD